MTTPAHKSSHPESSQKERPSETGNPRSTPSAREEGAAISASDTRADALWRRLLALAVPTLGQLIAEPAFILIDTAIVGHVSNAALAGLSLGSTIVLTAVGLCIFLAYSTTSHVAQLFGAGRSQEGMRAGIDGLWLATAIGVILAIGLFCLAEPLCAFLGGQGDDLHQGVIYTQAVVIGVPGMLLVYAANGIFRGLQKARVTLVAAVAGAVLNTVLDVVFVIGLGWGIQGSGVATCVAQWFMGLFLLIPAVREARRLDTGLAPRLSGIAAAGGEGLPLFLRTLALQAGLVATVMAAAALGSDVLAGYQVVNATWSFALNVLDALAIAGQSLVAAQIGRGDRHAARKLLRLTARAGLALGVVVGAVFVALAFAAPAAFSASPQIQAVATVGMVVAGLGLPLQGWMWALDGILIGAGDFRYLALTCAFAAGAHVCALLVIVFFVAPAVPGMLVRTALLWTSFDLVLMGGRAVANGLRARKDVWMRLP